MATKTPITVLQELMVKQGTLPQFCMEEADANGLFQCVVSALGERVAARGRNKKEAKQEAARLLLARLAEKGRYFPQQGDDLQPSGSGSSSNSVLLVNHVGMLKDMCCLLHLGEPEFTCLSESGPPHCRQFTLQCCAGSVVRSATSSTKKDAKQKAAQLIMDFYSMHLHDKIQETEERLNVEQLNEQAKKSYSKQSTETPWRPNMGLKIANYHLGMKEAIEDEVRSEVISRLKGFNNSADPVPLVEQLLQLMGMEYKWDALPSTGSDYVLLKILHSDPPAYLSSSLEGSVYERKQQAALEAINYITIMVT